MVKNKPILIFIIILIAVIIIAISVVVSMYNKNKPIVPDSSIGVVSSNDMAKIKTAYEQEGKKQEFLELCSKIELAVANKFLDGSITNDEELNSEISKINKILKTSDWSYLELEASTYWMGVWQLDAKGAITFTFENNNMKPDWANEQDVKKYIK